MDLMKKDPPLKHGFSKHCLVSDDGTTVLVSGEAMQFRISFLPGLMIVYGDIDELVIACPICKTSQDMRGWVLDNVESKFYFLDNQPIRFREYQLNRLAADDLCEELNIEKFASCQNIDGSLVYRWRQHIMSNPVSNLVEHELIDTLIQSALDYSDSTLCAYEAVRCFANLSMNHESSNSIAERPAL